MYDLNAIQIFVKVVENEGFTAAANKLDMPKSKVSRVINKLEQELGSRLLERTTRQIRLSESGRLFYQYAQRIIEEAEQAELAMQAMSEQVSGRLRISASLSVGQNLLGRHLSDFLNQHPNVQVDLELNNRRVDLVEENFDAAIRIGELATSSLVARRIGTTHTYLYASKAYLQKQAEPRIPEALAAHKLLIMSDAISKKTLKLFDKNNKKELIKIESQIKVNDFNTVLELVKKDLGIAALPHFIGDNKKNIERVLSAWKVASAPIYVVYPSHRGATPKLKAFIQFLTSTLSPLLR